MINRGFIHVLSRSPKHLVRNTSPTHSIVK